VLEQRDVHDSGNITIPYIRLLSESDKAGAPMIYLEGGPGGSGIEALEDGDFTEPFRHILANRDIVLVDQRGTGDAEPELECWRNYTFPLVPSPTPAERLETIKRMASDCAEQMRLQGIDLAGYNTNESADDIADLAKHLGAEKVVLFGGSYGSHLALAVLRRHEALVERGLLALVEGPDDTFKRPHQLDDMLVSLDDMSSEPDSAWPFDEPPSSAVKEILQQFEEPELAISTDVFGRETKVEIARHDLELILFNEMGDDNFWRNLPGTIKKLRDGDLSDVADEVIDEREYWISHPMFWATDCASGASTERLDQIEEQLVSSIASIPLDFPFPYICEAWNVGVLPSSFRAPIRSDVPVLLISGELDPRTPLANAENVAKHLPNAVHLRIGGVAHDWTDAYEHSDGLRTSIRKFLAGESVASDRYTVPFQFEEIGQDVD
ncbi:MAG: alpha/beta hydrolase, partial [Geminicoccaceae bacterium]